MILLGNDIDELFSPDESFAIVPEFTTSTPISSDEDVPKEDPNDADVEDDSTSNAGLDLSSVSSIVVSDLNDLSPSSSRASSPAIFYSSSSEEEIIDPTKKPVRAVRRQLSFALDPYDPEE